MATPLKIDKERIAPADVFTGDLLPHTVMMAPDTVLCLYAGNVPGLAAGEDKRVSVSIVEYDSFVDPSSGRLVREGGGKETLARFAATIRRDEGGAVLFEDVEVTEGALSAPPEGNVPYVKVRFFDAQTDPKKPLAENGSTVYCVPLLPADKITEEEGDAFELGYAISDENGKELGSTEANPAFVSIPRGFVPAAFYTAGQYAAAQWAQVGSRYLGDLYGEAVRDHTLTPVSERSDRMLEVDIKADYAAEVERALKEIRDSVQDSDNPHDIYVEKLLRYHDTVKSYHGRLRALQQASPGPEMQRHETHLAEEKRMVEELRAELDEYFFTNDRVPYSFHETRRGILEAEKRIADIDEFLDHPVVKVLAILPGGSCVTGFCKILQGKYVEGLIDVGLELITYGSWSRYKTMAQLFRNFRSYRNTPMGALKSLICFRYTKALQGSNLPVKALGQIASAADPGFGALFKAIDGCRALKGVGNEMRDLLAQRALVARTVRGLRRRTDMASADEVVQFLLDTNTYHDFLLVAGFLKAVKTGHGVATDAATAIAEAADELGMLSAHGGVLPSAGEAGEAGRQVRNLLQYLEEHDIDLGDVLERFPDREIRDRRLEEFRNHQGSPNMPAPEAFHSRKELVARLEEIMRDLDTVIPTRRRYLDANGWTSLNVGLLRPTGVPALEDKVDKLCGELQTLARLCGYEQFDLRSWFYADSITINGGTPRAKKVIVGRGTSVIGETKCREVIDLVAR